MSETNSKPTQSVPSINDNLPSSSPSGKTVLYSLGALALAFFMLLLYAEYFK